MRQDDLNRSLADLASITRTSTTYADASLGSAAEALDNAAETRASRRGPVTMFGYGLYDSDPVLAAQLGFTLDLPHDMVAGAALGVGRLTTEMAFGGHSDFDAGEALVFLGQSEKFGIDWVLAGTAHRFEGDVQRGYRNGTAIDQVSNSQVFSARRSSWWKNGPRALRRSGVSGRSSSSSAS